MSGVASASADLGNNRDGDEGKVNLMGLPLLPAKIEAAPGGGRKPELGQDGIGAKKVEASSMVSSPQFGGEEVPENGRRQEPNEAIVEREVSPVNPPSQADLGISQGDRRLSGGT